MHRPSRAAWKRALPWQALVLLLWGTQVAAIAGSPFTLEVTMLQGVFVLAFLVLILLIAEANTAEARDHEA